jgi:hypothetical protein
VRKTRPDQTGLTARLEIAEVSQDEADRLRDALPPGLSEGFDDAFNCETNNVQPPRRWALPAEMRTYLVVRLDGLAYLLVGINEHLNIPSFARIASAPRGHAAECMRLVVGDWLVPRLRAAGRKATYCRTTTPGGWRVLAALQSAPPAGIKSIVPGTAWRLELA